MKLKRGIGGLTLLFLTINMIIGLDLFFLPSIGAFYAGNASLISWFLAAIGAIIIAFCFGELVSMFPKAGGIYEFVKNGFGEFTGFVIGWTTWVVSNITIAMLLIGALYYILPESPFFIYIIIAIFIILFFSFVSYRGIKFSSMLLLFFGILTILSLLVIVLPGFFFVNISNFTPFFTMPYSEIFIAMFFVSETFFGWEAVTFLSEEVKNPRKNIPRMLVIATFIICIIALSVAFVALGVLNWQILGSSSAPLTTISEVIFGSEFGKYFAILFFIPLIGTVAGWIISSPRLIYAMSRDKVLPHWLSKIHPKYNTPHYAIIFQAIIAIIVTIIGFGSYMILLNLLMPLVIITYIAVLLVFVKFRMPKNLKRKRVFKSPFGEYGAILVILTFIILFANWAIEIAGAIPLLIIDIFLVILGVPLYFIIKLQTDEKYIEKFYDRISFLWDKVIPIWFGKKEIQKVIKNARVKKNYKVLDFGCATGTTTLELAKKVGEKGTVIAVDLSEKQLQRAIKKIDIAMKASNVIFIKERHLTPLERESFDAIVSAGALENFCYPAKNIREVIKLLKPGKYFSFLAFGKSLGIPAAEFLTDENSIREAFLQAGYEVDVKRVKKRFTEYWYIWGKR